MAVSQAPIGEGDKPRTRTVHLQPFFCSWNALIASIRFILSFFSFFLSLNTPTAQKHWSSYGRLVNSKEYLAEPKIPSPTNESLGRLISGKDAEADLDIQTALLFSITYQKLTRETGTVWTKDCRKQLVSAKSLGEASGAVNLRWQEQWRMRKVLANMWIITYSTYWGSNCAVKIQQSSTKSKQATTGSWGLNIRTQSFRQFWKLELLGYAARSTFPSLTNSQNKGSGQICIAFIRFYSNVKGSCRVSSCTAWAVLLVAPVRTPEAWEGCCWVCS